MSIDWRFGLNRRSPERGNLIAAERRSIIHEQLLTHGTVKVAALAKALGVAENTIRDDLDVLAGEGMLVRVHGGAVLEKGSMPSPPYTETRDAHLEEKCVIGSFAVNLIPESGSVFVFGGSTTYQMITRMPAHPKLHIYTNSLVTATYLATNNVAPVDIVGGTIVPEALTSDMSLCWDWGALDKFSWDVAFLGTAGIDVERGLTTPSRNGARVAAKILERVGKLIVLCDSSKFGLFSHVQICPVSSIDVLVTDAGMDPEIAAGLSDNDVDVMIARPSEQYLDLSTQLTQMQ